MTVTPGPSPLPSPLPATNSRRILAAAWLAGLARGLPFLIVLAPFGLVFGVAASNAGLSLLQVFAFSTIVLAGASQITALQLMTEQAPLIVVLLSALAVNLRLAMYSASLVPWFGQASGRVRAAIAFLLIDQTFALSLRHFEDNPRLTMAQRVAFFMGTATMLALPWPVFACLGATLGRAIPPRFALDFAIPITFLAMIAPMLRSSPHLAAAVVGFGLAVLLADLPSGLGLIVAAPVAMMVGAGLEWRRTKRGMA